QTLDVVRQHSDKLEVVGLAAHSRTDEVVAQARAFEVCHVAFGDEALASDSRIDEARQVVDTIAAAHPGEEGTVGVGPDAVLDLVRLPEVDVVVNAL
ncbi:1-deoxy-D-xylulose-5-phosphate reductoisomerase, partial [Adlercreutzia equolifaciens]|nr:1-deoxy-D-xylulose-5-phosphate reductoisomerase [Adlercreutzia equolifaciens]